MTTAVDFYVDVAVPGLPAGAVVIVEGRHEPGDLTWVHSLIPDVGIVVGSNVPGGPVHWLVQAVSGEELSSGFAHMPVTT